jgi:hypothetical protein
MKYLFVLSILFIAGCASISEEECRKGNWEAFGYRDAMRGTYEPKTNDYRKDCSEYGVSVKGVEYMKGFESGLKDYCTFNRGLEMGVAGKNAHKYCEEVSPDFKKAYQKGYAEYLINKKKIEAIKALKEKLITDNGGRECNSDNDCNKDGECRFGLCANDQSKVCSFNHDCQLQITCASVTGYTQYSDNVFVRVCADN